MTLDFTKHPFDQVSTTYDDVEKIQRPKQSDARPWSSIPVPVAASNNVHYLRIESYVIAIGFDGTILNYECLSTTVRRCVRIFASFQNEATNMQHSQFWPHTDPSM